MKHVSLRHVRQHLRWQFKRLLFPGFDLHTRCRYRYLPRLFKAGPIETLDAGFGNGALSLAAHRRGNHVLGVSISARDVQETSAFFAAQGIPSSAIQFQQLNLYDLATLGRTFDEIVCSETLEHVRRDGEVVSMFANLLRPGGRLILCAPYAPHAENALGRVDVPEDGGHVRDGYTLETYAALLGPAGLRITTVLGLGSPLLCRVDRVLRRIRALPFGHVLVLPAFLVALPMSRLDYPNPRVPLSLVVVAEKASN